MPLIVSLKANCGPEDATDEIKDSSTKRRLDALLPTWQSEFVTRNLWRHRDDTTEAAVRIMDILSQVDPKVVVALGRQVAAELGMPSDHTWLGSSVRPDGVVVFVFLTPLA